MAIGPMFYNDITPLIAEPDVIRAARIYPGGEHLDAMIGTKPSPEAGWYYPEAWLFSPAPAINPGSLRTDEGETVVYDREGTAFRWREYAGARRDDVLGPYTLGLSVKILDGEVTLPKEFHFRECDRKKLLEYPGIRSFEGTLTKPEVWVRHPDPRYEAGISYIGFRDRLTPERLLAELSKGNDHIEDLMNAVTIDPAGAFFIPGGIVHSLGPGVYYEVLADGDLKITLQQRFAGRELSMGERLDKLEGGGENDLQRALELIDYDSCGAAVVESCRRRSRPVDDSRSVIIRNPYFEADWLDIPAEQSYRFENTSPAKPRIIIAVSGLGMIETDRETVRISALDSTAAWDSTTGSKSTAASFEEFRSGHPCLGAVVHYVTEELMLINTTDRSLLLLHVCEPDRPGSENE